jgi:hypothetical protein
MRKAAVDVFGNGVFLMVPSFYMTTGILKGETVEGAASQLSTEWVEASTGTCAFWLPTCAVNFALIPPHSRILSITICSSLHKTWLSLLSNASRIKERQVGAAVGYRRRLSRKQGQSGSPRDADARSDRNQYCSGLLVGIHVLARTRSRLYCAFDCACADSLNC